MIVRNITMSPLHSHRAIPIEAVAFLGAVLVIVLLMVIFFLYLNKSLCFSECGGFPCIDKIPSKDSTLDSDDEANRGDRDYLSQSRLEADVVSIANSEAVAGPRRNSGRSEPGRDSAQLRSIPPDLPATPPIGEARAATLPRRNGPVGSSLRSGYPGSQHDLEVRGQTDPRQEPRTVGRERDKPWTLSNGSVNNGVVSRGMRNMPHPRTGYYYPEPGFKSSATHKSETYV